MNLCYKIIFQTINKILFIFNLEIKLKENGLKR